MIGKANFVFRRTGKWGVRAEKCRGASPTSRQSAGKPRVVASPPVVILRESGVSSTPRLIGSIADVSGILDRPVPVRNCAQGRATTVNNVARFSLSTQSTHVRDLAAGFARVLPTTFRPFRKRGRSATPRGAQGMPDAWRVRSRVRSGSKHTR